MDVIVDVDGTIANNKHRVHLVETSPPQWDKFFELIPSDTPYEPVVEVVRALFKMPLTRIVMVTGRPERYSRITHQWLRRHNIPHHWLYMRQDEDHRPDHIVKSEILDLIKQEIPLFDPVLAIDDRPSVVAMWKSRGLEVLQRV